MSTPATTDAITSVLDHFTPPFVVVSMISARRLLVLTEELSTPGFCFSPAVLACDYEASKGAFDADLGELATGSQGTRLSWRKAAKVWVKGRAEM